MSGTSIEWTDETWNPVRGCSRVSEGCRHCYAETMTALFSDPGQWGHGFAKRTKAGARWTGNVALIESKLEEPLRWKEPRMIFVNSAACIPGPHEEGGTSRGGSGMAPQLARSD